MTRPGRRLVARTRRLDAEVDLLAVAGESGVLFERERRGLAGRGEALRVDLPGGDPAAAAAAWATAVADVEVDDAVGLPGTGPVAFGALPFDRSAPGSLVVPALVVGRAEDGTRWITTLSADGAEPPAVPATDEPPAESSLDPGEVRVRPGRPAAEWCAAVAAARERIREGRLTKVVLAREVVVEAERPWSRHALLTRLRSGYPTCWLTSVDGMVGASPELLLSRRGDIVRSHPMAGTARRGADPTADARLAAALLGSTKDRVEHQITIDMVHDTLLPWCSYVDSEPEPSVVAMANVQHLATLMEGRLSHPPASVLELVAALHPTPAVCGDPRDAALEVIAELEGADRGRWAGPVGWVDAEGNGEWAVGIRSADLHGGRAQVLAGVGVVADSEPDAELAETRAKLQALLGSLLRP
jgi:menaquinone-specific isochorismate synthase